MKKITAVLVILVMAFCFGIMADFSTTARAMADWTFDDIHFLCASTSTTVR